MRLNVIPLVGVGSVRFGMSRGQIRAVWGNAEEFQKTPEATAATDDFGFCHVYYDGNNCCEAIEVFDDAEVLIEGRKVFPLETEEMLKRFPEFEEDGDGPISFRWAAAVYAPDGAAESILFGKEGYFE